MKKGNVHLYGSFTEHKGRYYSNTRHLRLTDSIGHA